MESTQLRNADFSRLAEQLQDEQSRKVDIVAPATALRASGGRMIITGAEPVLDESGVTSSDGVFDLLPTAVDDLAGKLGIPPQYTRRLHAERSTLFDQNVNAMLHGSDGVEPDGRQFMVRGFTGTPGVVRAVLSDRYGVIDHLDCLTAAMDGVRQAGVEVVIDSCDLTSTRMVVKIKSEAVRALAPTLLAGYRSPFGGAEGTENPTVFAGFQISNSETGHGAFSIVPRMIVQICNNGMTIKKDAMRSVHLGERMDEGVIKWTESTQRKQLELITARTRDAVATFLDVGYMEKVIAGLEEKAGVPVDPAKAPEVIKQVGKKLVFDKATTEGVLGHFIQGGQFNAGGVMHAVTSFAQTVEDGDAAFDLEDAGVKAMEVAASI